MTVKVAMVSLYRMFPLVCYAIGSVMMMRFKLDETEHARIRVELQRRPSQGRLWPGCMRRTGYRRSARATLSPRSFRVDVLPIERVESSGTDNAMFRSAMNWPCDCRDGSGRGADRKGAPLAAGLAPLPLEIPMRCARLPADGYPWYGP